MGLIIWRKILFLNMMSVLLYIPSHTEGAQIKLVGSRCSGRLEIYYNGLWGTVCDDSWDIKDTQVVCRELDCGTASSYSTYGGGSGKIWLDEVACSGSECSLTQCSRSGFGTHDCTHSEDVGVVCSAGLPSPSLSPSSSALSPGETLILTCSISTPLCIHRDVNFYKDGFYIGKQTSGILTLFNVDPSRQGSYTCRYSTSSITSSYSSQVNIMVVTLPKPSISVNPVSKVTWGNTVDITCSLSTQHLGGTLTLQQTSGSSRKGTITRGSSYTFNIPNVNFEHEGSYRCQYDITISSRPFKSPQSDPASFYVTVSLPKPRISVNPVREVTWGNTVAITCSVLTQHLGGTFTLQQTSGSFTKKQTTSRSSSTFNIPNVDFVHEGSYQCQYETTVSRRPFKSPQSDSVRFSVTVRLPQANISLTTPYAVLVWGPGHSEVTRGYSFSITCSILPQYPRGFFSLIFSGSNSNIKQQSAVNHSASFQFPAAEYEHQGNYSCIYEVTISTHSFTSNSSELLSVSVNPSPIPLLVGGAVGGVVLLLLLLLIGLCLMWRRRHRKPVVKTDPTACVMNTYNIVGRANDEDDEGTYGNAEAITCHQSDDDDSDDYENGDFMAASNMDKHVYNPGAVEEEEEDDAIYANTDMYPESSTKEHLNPGRRVVEGQSDEDEDNIYANYDG